MTTKFTLGELIHCSTEGLMHILIELDDADDPDPARGWIDHILKEREESKAATVPPKPPRQEVIVITMMREMTYEDFTGGRPYHPSKAT